MMLPLKNGKVSIHAPARGATVQGFVGAASGGFQSTHPRGVRRHAGSLQLPRRCFNPRTRAGCDEYPIIALVQFIVSIHAPARGATARGRSHCLPLSLVSIHAPARGATQDLSVARSTHLCFNPRTRAGCDKYPASSNHRWDVSIHAPARGATAAGYLVIRYSARFNPRTRAGCDIPFSRYFAIHISFNPRTRAGCDQRNPRCVSPSDVSIHAPARGATNNSRIDRYFLCVSIHAPARGATAYRIAFQNSPLVSIHAPARGATATTIVSDRSKKFQSTHPRGVRRPTFIMPRQVPLSFNPRTRAGCDRKRLEAF